MIGMVNAAGVTQADRPHPGNPTTRAPSLPDVGEPPMWVRSPKSAQGATETSRAVQPVEFQNAQAENRLPSSDQTEPVNSGQPQGGAEAHLGTQLDTSA
jgi:hypothetical protein